MACLDTSVLLDLAGRSGRRKQLNAQAALRRLEHDRPHATTRFTLAELLVGVELAADSRQWHELERILSKLQILEFDARAMRVYAKIFAHLQKLGLLPGVMDTLIASVALANGRKFITRNPDHFQNVPGLRLERY